jgi:hypothetical protein
MKAKTFTLSILFIFLLGIAGGIISAKGYDNIEESRFLARYQEMKIKYPLLRVEWYRTILQSIEVNGIETLEIKPGYIVTGDRAICAIIDQESQWNDFAISEKNAKGLMQVMYFHLPKNQRNHSEVLFEAHYNIQHGTRIFADNWKTTNGNLILALSKYERGNNKTPNVKYLAEIFAKI